MRVCTIEVDGAEKTKRNYCVYVYSEPFCVGEIRLSIVGFIERLFMFENRVLLLIWVSDGTPAVFVLWYLTSLSDDSHVKP